jgi:transposase-like protein
MREGAMIKRKRRVFTPEFKAEAVRLYRLGERSFDQLAYDLAISQSSLHNWVKDADAAVTTPPDTAAENEELKATSSPRRSRRR